MEYSNLSKFKEDLWLCARCGDCSLADKKVASHRDVFLPCAVKNVLGFEAYSSRGRIMVMNDLLDGKLKADKSVVDWAYTCTTCKNCQETCTATAEGIRLPEMTEALRTDLVTNGFEMPKHAAIEESIVNLGNPYQESEDRRKAVFGNREWPEKADVVYFVGCTATFRESEIAKATAEVLEKAGVSYTVLPDEQCCGSVLLRLGRVKAFDALTEKNIESVEKTGAKTVVTSCAGCFRTWKIDLPNKGHTYGFEVLHITEFLDRLTQDKKIAFKSSKPIKVTYHDPCHLGRHAEVYEAPRRVINSVENVQLVEMETNKRYAHCCGSGGGVKSSYGEVADKIAADRIREAERTGASVLITACPFCHKGLVDGANYIHSKMQVVDLPNFLLPLSTKAKVVAKTVENPLKPQFMDYLRNHPKIFDGLKKDAVIDYEIEGDRFHVLVLDNGAIQVNSVRSENPDVELAFSEEAVKQLTVLKSEDEYAQKFGSFFKKPTDEVWIKFNLRRNIVKLLMKGYRKFAQKAGLI